MIDRVESPEGQIFSPVEDLEVRAKFFTGPVQDEAGNLYFLKAVKDDNSYDLADLENEVRWNQTIGPRINNKYWAVPHVVTHAPDFEWAVFEHAGGQEPTEDKLYPLLGVIGHIATTLYHLPLGREGSNLVDWYRERLERSCSVTHSQFFDDDTRGKIADIVANEDLLNGIQAGIVHGNLSLANLLIQQIKRPQLYIVDSEFGTLAEKPEWDKPRFDDMAFFYHLLCCQHQQPEAAELFKQRCWYDLRDDAGMTRENFDKEFHLSVLERTISMMSHFIINRAPGKKVNDVRRLRSEPYVALVHESIKAITSS